MTIKLDTLAVGHARGRHTRPVLQGLHGELPPLVCLLGSNGCGKTTLLRTIMGFIPPLQGSVWVNGLNVHNTPRAQLAAHLAYVPQRSADLSEHRVLDVVLMGTMHRWRTQADGQTATRLATWASLCRGPQAQHHAEALAALHTVGLADVQDQHFECLSGGQQQLVLLARALAQGANILVLDEPTANLDPHNSRKLGQILHKLVYAEPVQHSVILSTHQPELALQLQAHCVLLRQGQVQIEGNAHKVLGSAMLENLYG